MPQPGAAFRQIRTGVEAMPPGDLPRHRHREPYANVVLCGVVSEASFSGFATAGPGEVLLHAAFDCHANFGGAARGPQLLRLPWAADGPEGRRRVRDPDLLVRLAERDPLEAQAALAEMIEAAPAQPRCWTQVLAEDLAEGRVVGLRRWAEARGLSPETMARRFRRRFGTSPRQFRLEARARRAWLAVRRGGHSLTSIAYQHDFADLAHMSRSVRALTGAAPSAWRPRAGDELAWSAWSRSG